MTDQTPRPRRSTRKKTDDAAPTVRKQKEADHGDPEQTPAELGIVDLPSWKVEDYGPHLTGPSAAKIASSAIAPIVAITRGYRSVDEETDAKALAKRMQFPSNRDAQYKGFVNAAEAAGVMAMPWFRHDEVANARRNRIPVDPVSWQYRPVNPPRDADGREAKYMFVKGQHAPIGTHPCMPASWLHPNGKTGDADHVVLVAEGLLKADAALTALLLDAGVDKGDLDAVDGDGAYLPDLDERLWRLLTELDASHQIAVCSIAGVGNWRSNPDWATFEKGREWWLGPDGDVSEKVAVWKQSTDLWQFLQTNKRASAVRLLSPDVQRDSDSADKIGIDDFLAEWGTWSDLLEHLRDELPPRPANDESELVGQWRVTDNGTKVSECQAVLDMDNKPTGAVRWVDRVPLGGRLASFTRTRGASQSEVLSGRINPAIEASRKDGCEIELSWIDADDESLCTATISGPAAMLDAEPSSWYRFDPDIPSEVRSLPQWPPTGPEGRKWVSAIKAHRASERVDRVAWEHMGWVPVDTEGRHLPAFIVGTQVIADPAVRDRVLVDPTLLRTLGEADQFGVIEDIEGDFGNEAWRTYARKVFSDVLDAFIVNKVWTDPGAAAVVLSVGLRPVLPLRSITSVVLSAPPGAGKTWTAQKMLSFWEARPGRWSNQVTGSASSTYAATEDALNRAILWVVDDLAPSPSANKAAQEQDTLGALIRSVFNGIGKKRSDINRNQAATKNPRCPLITTGENAMSVGSVQERAINIDISPGALNPSHEPTDTLDTMQRDEGTPAKLAAILVHWVRHQAKKFGWQRYVQSLADTREEQQNLAEHTLRGQLSKKDAKRPAVYAADLNMVLRELFELGRELGVDDEYLELLGGQSLSKNLIDLCARSFSEAAESRPGPALLNAIRTGLQAGHWHIDDGREPKAPPQVEGWPDLAYHLGWRNSPTGFESGRGPTIGSLFVKTDGTPCVVFHMHAAFNEARSKYPTMILPGQTSKASWNALINDGLSDTTYAPQPGTIASRVSRSLVPHGRTSGTVVPLSTLLGWSGASTDDPSEQEAE